jgi:hypothetical protein
MGDSQSAGATGAKPVTLDARRPSIWCSISAGKRTMARGRAAESLPHVEKLLKARARA